jgi:phosphatidylserine/phosphatidylglycerophosphate/cardiolipin synthase-like enzyme
MLRIHCDDLWSTVARLSKRNVPRVAAVAYVSSDKKVAFRRNDVLITDASNPNIASGQTSAAVLRSAFDRGAAVYSITGLHAKVVCLGRYSVIGSANLSANSVSNLIEAGIITDHPGVLADARSVISRLQSVARQVDDTFLRRIERIKVARPKPLPTKPRLPKTNDARATWVVGVHELPDEQFPDEAVLAKKGAAKARQNLDSDRGDTSWIRFTA